MINDNLFLSNLNNLLSTIEKQIIERAIICLETAQKKLTDKDAFTTDYEVEANVQYYLKNTDEPVHVYNTIFNYKHLIIDKEYDMLCDGGNGIDWHREGDMPKLDTPYCYLLHDLINHSKQRLEKKIFSIENIWVDVICTDQKGMRINKDGTIKKLFYKKQ